jgi:hypothetical protein
MTDRTIALALSLSRHTKTETFLQRRYRITHARLRDEVAARRTRKATRRIIIGGCP